MSKIDLNAMLYLLGLFCLLPALLCVLIPLASKAVDKLLEEVLK